MRVITGDGTEGDPSGAPYDRIIATASVRFGEVPYDWVAQTKPGGVLVTPMRTDYSGALTLMRLTVNADGSATGHPIGKAAFMAVRGQRTPLVDIDGLDPDDPRAAVRVTTLKPWRVAESHDVCWAIGTQVPRCVWEHQPPSGDRTDHLLWLLEPGGKSWAVVRYSGKPGPRLVRQYGPRRLWDEVEGAFRVWAAAGKPSVEDISITSTAAGQSTNLAALATAATA